MTPQWVDVNERQPSKPGIYLVVDEENAAGFSEFYDDQWIWVGGHFRERVVYPGHWLENPVDIKKEEDVKNQTS